MARSPLPQDFVCATCGADFSRPPTRGHRPINCLGCRKPKGGNTPARRAAWAARRARKAGARVESFTPVEIFERDGWVCGICDEPVDRTKVYPDPNSSSLDHIRPLSLGGEHSRANTRLAHLSCDKRRGAARGEDLTIWLEEADDARSCA